MSRKEIALYIIVSIIVFYILGYALGSTKVLLFQSAGDGKSAFVNVCDVDGEYRDENDNCRNFSKVKINMEKATQITGGRWASYGGAFGFLFGLGISDWVYNIKNKKRETK